MASKGQMVERPLHVVVAGQMPPPVGGQNINIKRIHDLLDAEPNLNVNHLKFEFTKEWSEVRRAGFGKVLELLYVVCRAVRLRKEGPIDFLLYPAGGPHVIPIIRDMLLLPILALLSRRVVIHFQAAGLSERLKRLPSWFGALCRVVYRSCTSEAAVLTPFGERDAIAAGIEKVTLLPNAFEDEAGEVLLRERGERMALLNVGHLCSDKGIPDLIAAFGRLSGDYPNAVLVLVGEPLAPYSSEDLRADIQLSGAADRIEWKGLLQGAEVGKHYGRRENPLFMGGTGVRFPLYLQRRG